MKKVINVTPRPGEIKKLQKLMKKLSNRFDNAKGKPVAQARIMKTATRIQQRLDFCLLGTV